MRTQYFCDVKDRAAKLRETEAISPGPALNGIDYLEVEPGQTQLDVHFVHDLGLAPATPLDKRNVEIRGGVRVRDPRVKGVTALGDVLTVEVETPGDFSPYVLRLVKSAADDAPPDGIDPALSEIEFSFKANCPNPFDCRPASECPSEPVADPPLDYLAKDYTSFRRLMLDRLSALLPNWRERSAADLWVTLIELIAFRADELSYFQDAVAAEAYLGTARRRISVRRHARLLDYAFHDGRNARAWVSLEVEGVAEGRVLCGCDPKTGLGGTVLLTHVPALGRNALVDSALARVAMDGGAQIFETLDDVTLYEAHNKVEFYTWSDEECCLPKGATRAYLRDDGPGRLRLRRGDVVLFEEKRSPANGREEDADPGHRHAVRLVSTDPSARLLPDGQRQIPPPRIDPLTGVPVVEIRWAAEDSLPFPLCLSSRNEGVLHTDMSVARANVVLADHGRTVSDDVATEPTVAPDDVPNEGPYRPLLSRTLLLPVTQQTRVRKSESESPMLVDRDAPAAAAFTAAMADVRPAIDLRDRDRQRWTPRPDLLASGRFALEFVVEVEDDGRAYLRFGDGANGRRPRGGDKFSARYRIGGGQAGNVGPEAIVHIVGAFDGIARVRNPMPARGGTDPHPMKQAKLYAPQAFRRQERAVTAADYGAAAERSTEVERAVATRRWTGSWHTMFVTTDRRGGGPIDFNFEKELRFDLERFRLAGHDLKIDAPRFVPLDIAFDVCIRRGYFAPEVERRLLETFSARGLPDGGTGFFHPDRFTFGAPVYLSALIARAMGMAGVSQVKPRRFQRWGRTPAGEQSEGAIRMGRLEIARLDNDPNAPENGRIEFRVVGEA
jgi:hypothetical protein